MALALSGIASGLDTDSMITSLMAIESQGKTRLQLSDLKAQSRQETLKDVATRLKALRDAAAALRSPATWAPVQTTASSDAARVGVRALGGVAPGDHTVEVSSLATAAQRAFTVAAGGGTLQIGAYAYTADPDATADTIAAALNADSAAPVSAVVAGGSLVLTAKATGGAGAFTVTGGPLTEQAAYARAGADAVYTLDGVPKTSSSNVITDGVLGMEITLKAPTAAPVVVGASSAAPDRAAIAAKVKAVVDAYNAAADLMRNELAEKKVADPTSNVQALQGLFNGDPLLAGALSAMRSALGDVADLGISTGAASGTAAFSKDAVAGKLVFDPAKFDTAMATGLADVKERLAATDGFAARLGDAVSPIAGERIDSRLASVDAERKRLADSLTTTGLRLEAKEKALRARFALMESALANAQQQQSWLEGQLAALP